MLLNLPSEVSSNSGSELPGSSDDGLLALALRKMMKKEVELMVINAVEKLVVPMIGSLIRKVVKEEIQSALMTHGNGNHAHEATMSTESRTLQLKFLDEVSLPVLTGKEIEGKGGTTMRLAIVDNMTGQLVTSGPEASGKVEILLLHQADDDDDKHNWSTEDFNNKIIGESDKEKPRVAKGTYVRLKEGVGILSDVKLGHGSSWKKRCLCRLGARFVDNPNGNRVKEAWTESFMIEDCRGKLYEKHYPPSLLDEVWRLENIGRDGGPCKALYEEKIFTVQDFRFLLSIDPQRLRRIFKGSKGWKTVVDHARTCIIDDKKIYLYPSPSKFDFAVAFDAVGQLMGIVRNSHYVRLDNLSEFEQANAKELLLLAFANREDVTFVDDETSLVLQFPYESHDIGVATDSVRNDEYAPLEPDTSSPTIGPSSSSLIVSSPRRLLPFRRSPPQFTSQLSEVKMGTFLEIEGMCLCNCVLYFHQLQLFILKSTSTSNVTCLLPFNSQISISDVAHKGNRIYTGARRAEIWTIFWENDIADGVFTSLCFDDLFMP